MQVRPNAETVPDTFPKCLLENRRRFGGLPAMRHKDRGIWQSWTWSEQVNEICALALGLQALGLKAGDKLAVIGENRPRLYWTFAACQSIGAIPVPVYADAVAEEMAYVLNHAGVSFAVVQDQEQVDKLQGFAADIPGLSTIIFDEKRGLETYSAPNLHDFAEVQQSGRDQLIANPDLADKWEEGIAQGGSDDVSIMLYTSGTTGRSKGVMIRAGGAVRAARDTVAFDRLTHADNVLAYLPLAWVGDHYMNYAQGFVSGFCMNCPESMQTIANDLREIGPSFYFAPPRVFESLLTDVTIRMLDAGRFKQRLFNLFITIARKYGEAILERRPVPLYARLAYGLGEVLIYGPLKNVLGLSHIRVAYTAGEAIGEDLFSFFRALGINLKQLYGQTEAFLYITVQEDGKVRSDTVGPATPGVDLKIAESGEILFRSPGMFDGYYKQEEESAEAITEDGYVRTGDAGFIDHDGQLKIIDRARDVGRFKSGSLFAPKYVENALKFFPNIKEAVAYGDGRDFCAVFLNIDLMAVGNWAERKNIAYASYQELAAHPEIYKLIAAHVAEANQRLAREPMMAQSQIRRFLILHKELDADDGELTRTQKVRRSFIQSRYQPLIDALFDGSKSCFVSTEVTYEDGRKGFISSNIRIEDAQVAPAIAGGFASIAEAAE